MPCGAGLTGWVGKYKQSHGNLSARHGCRRARSNGVLRRTGLFEVPVDEVVDLVAGEAHGDSLGRQLAQLAAADEASVLSQRHQQTQAVKMTAVAAPVKRPAWRAEKGSKADADKARGRRLPWVS